MAETLYELLTSVDVAQPFLVGNLLPYKGKIIIAGPPKSNKSWVCIAMAMAMAQGKPLFGAYAKASGKPIFPVYGKSRVLYLEWELGRQGVKDRVRGLVRPEDALGLDIFFHPRDVSLRMDTQEGKDAIEREIVDTQPNVIFIDPLAKAHGVNEDSSSEMGQVLRFQDYLVERYKVAIVTAHHTAKPSFDNPRRGGDRLRGSSAIFGDCDGVILVNRKSDESAIEPIIELNFELRRSEPMRSKFVRRLKSGEITYIGDSFVESAIPDKRP